MAADWIALLYDRLSANTILGKALGYLTWKSLVAIVTAGFFAQLLYKWKAHRARASTEHLYTVLVAHLVGDEKHRHHRNLTNDLVRSFASEKLIAIQPFTAELSVSASKEQVTAWRAAESRVQALLNTKGAHVLVWGEVASPTHSQKAVLRLIIQGGASRSAAGGAMYLLNDDFTMPENFSRDFSAVLASAVIANIDNKYGSTTTSAPALEAALERLRPFVEQAPATFPKAVKGQMLYTYAGLLWRLAERITTSSLRKDLSKLTDMPFLISRDYPSNGRKLKLATELLC